MLETLADTINEGHCVRDINNDIVIKHFERGDNGSEGHKVRDTKGVGYIDRH